MCKSKSRMLAGLLVLPLVWCQQQAQANFLLGTPSKLGPAVNSTWRENAPNFSADGKTLYFTSSRPGGSGSRSTWQVTRESLDGPWGNPESISSIGGDFSNGSSVTADGLELYFADGIGGINVGSPRPGGQGGYDIWVSKRATVDDDWGEPENLGPNVNSRSNDGSSSITADGLSLYFGSTRAGGMGGVDVYIARRKHRDDAWETPVNLGAAFNTSSNDWGGGTSADGLTMFVNSGRPGSNSFVDIWVATRSSIDEEFGTPVHFPRPLNVSPGTFAMDMSPDGSTLYYVRGHEQSSDIWELPLLPFESVSLNGPGATYQQDFDEALGVDGKRRDITLPTGWTSTDDGLFFDNTTSASFPAATSLGQATPIYNAGADQHSDRALALGVTGLSDGGMLQLLAGVEGQDATSFQLKFDMEVWDAAKRNVDLPGEAALDVTMEIDTGSGFAQLLDLGTVSTGEGLLRPDADYLNGNTESNRVQFDSSQTNVDIPAGSTLRIRWAPNLDVQSKGWVYGLDNVQLSIFGDVIMGDFPGDADLDGEVSFADFLVLSANFGEPGGWSEGDFDFNGTVQFEDFLLLSDNFGKTFTGGEAVPEPTGFMPTLLSLICCQMILRKSYR